MRQKIAFALETVGVVLLSTAGAIVHPAIGLMIAGVSLVVFGLAAERG